MWWRHTQSGRQAILTPQRGKTVGRQLHKTDRKRTMKYTNWIIVGLMTLLFAACSSDDDTTGKTVVTLSIPVDIYSSNQEVTSRAASQGDPGNDVVFDEPLYLYVYACVRESSGYELLTTTVSPSGDASASTWTLENENAQDEHWHKNVNVTFTISSAFSSAEESRVFAIASRTDLSGKLPTYAANTVKSTVEAMELNLSDVSSGDLKDIYSTPLKDTNNGIIKSNTTGSTSSGGTTTTMLTCSTVRLYHVAAKVDFTWEVPSTLQSTTEIASIQCTGLPTTCKIFEPTANPGGTGTCLVLDSSGAENQLDTGNKWLGRAYAFMLQPPSPGTINYTVSFGGSKPTTTQKSSSITPSTATYSNVFTGWYRVIATVE